MVEACKHQLSRCISRWPHLSLRGFTTAAQAVAGPRHGGGGELAAALWQATVGARRGSVCSNSRSTPRRSTPHLREQTPRVSFGRKWVEVVCARDLPARTSRASAPCSRPRPMTTPSRSWQRAARRASRRFRLHNSTVYRWNRVCYGICDGMPHLRIENRILPSGPTPRDEVANAAFWFGLISGDSRAIRKYRRTHEFRRRHANILLAAARARVGRSAQLGEWYSAAGRPADSRRAPPNGARGTGGSRSSNAVIIDLYLGTIEERVRSRSTGAQWQLDSLAQLADQGPMLGTAVGGHGGHCGAPADGGTGPYVGAGRARRRRRLEAELPHGRALHGHRSGDGRRTGTG